MSRILLQYVLPLVLPTVVFVAWIVLTEKRGASREKLIARLAEGPWFWLVVAGFALMAAGLGYLGLTEGASPGTTYQAPRYEDGRIVPGEFR
ncbi:MAG: hypothetical protein A3J29_21490 [Acidobacteria bacterium RIFCSPLOWO2_12_FULL_67_14b]|nr:MAG: hypothetical protein A3J29_21490 [Acidobacteria bacterium RIFCSPLOWO2_12_FULL_67_14b]